MQTNGSKTTVLSVLRHPLFLIVLIVKIIASALFISDIPAKLFVPFLSFFGIHPLSNVYQYFYQLGVFDAFPYPTLMLWITGSFFSLFSFFNNPETTSAIDLLLLRAPLLVSDVAILLFLISLNPAKKRLVMYLYWFSPIVFYINYIHGQLDIIPIALLLAALVLLFKNKLLPSAALLSFSILAKSHVLVIVPFILFYLWKRIHSVRTLSAFVGIVFIVYGILLLPYFNSQGFVRLVFLASEQFRLFDLNIAFSEGLAFYVVIAVYLYVVFKALILRRITKDMLLMFIGVTFTILVTLVRPAQGWYFWSIPFLVYFFSKQKPHLATLYWAFSGIYFVYFSLIPASDIFRVFQLIAPRVAALPVPFELINNLPGIHREQLVSIIFTLLSSALIYIAYLMFKYGIKTSTVFQEKAGIPVIGISGDSGAGKTTTTGFLTTLFGDKNSTVICGDDIHRWERGHEKWAKYTHLNPISNRLHVHYSHIANLKQGNDILRPHYDHATGKFTEEIRVKPKNIILDEGLHTFLIDQKALHDLKVYLDPDPQLNQYWKIERDVQQRGHDRAKVMETLVRRAPDKEKYILPQRANADIVITLMPLSASPSDKDYLAVKDYGKVSFTVKTTINIDPLLDTLEMLPGNSREFTYIDHDHQQVIITYDHSSVPMLQSILQNIDLDYTEYGVTLENIRPGVAGLIQIFILYCLNEKLKRSAPVNEIENTF